MPIATLQFNLPEEREEYELCMKAGRLSSMLWEFDQTHLRGATKYDNIPDQVMSSVIEEFSSSEYQEADNEMLDLINSPRGQQLIIAAIAGVRTLLYNIAEDAEVTIG